MKWLTSFRERNNIKKRIFLIEVFLVLRFASVGAISTALHLAIIWLLLSKTSMQIIAANMIAFVLAFLFSFSGNYIWTYKSPGGAKKAMLRFLIISGSAFILNNLLLAAIIKSNWLNPMMSAVCSALVIPGITFFASRFWGFQYRHSKIADLDIKNAEKRNGR